MSSQTIPPLGEHDAWNFQDREKPTDDSVLRRTFAAELTAGDGRTAHVRVVPFGEVARVADPPDWLEYDEEWIPGCFDHQLNAANRVLANFEHQRGIGGVVGHGLTLERQGDGYHGSFRLHETPDGDKTLMMVREGILAGISLEAIAVKSIRTAAGVVQRVKANLRGIAFCREGAFTGAQVLAVRTPPHQIVDEALLPVDMDPERVERLRAQGIVLPDRYQAHPEPTDTPPQGGTSEDGTRQPVHTTSSEEGNARITGGADASAAG